jgi:acyl-CoA dehydrogenase/isovaleryl-CoA dehydrogenase
MQIQRTVLRDDHELYRANVRRFLEQECLPRLAAWDAAGEQDRASWLEAGRAGVLCPAIAAEYGGGGGDFGHAAVLSEEQARAGMTGLGFGMHSNIIAPYIERIGTEAQKRRWLPGACSGETILAVAMTEPGSGSDLKAMRTTARRDGDHYVIDGSKTFISHGLTADLVVLACKTDPAAGAKGVSLILVETDREGFRRGRKLDKVGRRYQDTGELFFENLRVPAENLLGEEGRGFRYLMAELAQERLIAAAQAATVLETVLEQTIAYVKERKAFGQTVWDFQNTRFKLADVKAQALATRLLVDHCIGTHLERGLSAAEAALAKLHATETASRCLDELMQLHGGYGYMMEMPVARAWVDARVLRIAGGTSEVMRELIAREL